MNNAIPYALSFTASTFATFFLAAPMPYVVANKAEYIEIEKAKIEQGQTVELPTRSYNNPLAYGFTGAMAIASFIGLVGKVGDKPLIAPTQQPQQVQSQPVVINNNVAAPKVVNRVSVGGNGQARASRTVDDADRLDASGEWIKRLMFDEGGTLKRQHYKIDGVTQSGKTTFAEHLLTLMTNFFVVKFDPIASKSTDGFDGFNVLVEKLLLDPKYKKNKPNWSFSPYCADIDKAPLALDNFAKEIYDRQQSEEDYSKMPPIIFVIDEWDWIFSEHGKPAVTKLRKLIKVGAELNCYVVLIGQSPLSTDSGLSTSDFDQLVRISIGKSAIKVLGNHAQFPFKNRDELLAKAEALYNSGQRFALVQEHGVTPRLELIPHIIKPSDDVEEPQDDDEILDNVIPINRRAS